MFKGLKGPIKQGKGGKGKNREVQNQNEHSKKPKDRPANMYTHNTLITGKKGKQTKK